MPSGKNLLNYGVAQAGHMIASVIDNGGLRVATTAPMNSWIGFRWKADIAPELHEGDKLTLSLEDGDTLNGICFQVFFYDAAGKMLQRATFTKDNITSLKSLTVPAGAMTYDTCVFTYGKLSESTTSILHPQLELGDKRTCWEPPEKLRGGGERLTSTCAAHGTTGARNSRHGKCPAIRRMSHDRTRRPDGKHEG